jgi:hypothetical protein
MFRKDLLLGPHNKNFAEECLGTWYTEDLRFLVYGNIPSRRKKMRDVFRLNKPDNAFIAELIKDRQYIAIGIIASFYEFNEELQRMIINRDISLRKAYHKHHQFMRILEHKFICRAEKSEAQSYYSRYARTMDEESLIDCKKTKKLNMGCFASTLSEYKAKKLEEKNRNYSDAIWN